MSSPRIAVDTENGVPPWRQIRDQIEAIAGTDVLPVGSRLPTIRQLARDLGLAPGTVARAYRELETAGVTQTAGRQGTVVADRPDIAAAYNAAALRLAATDYVATVKALGVDQDSALTAVRAQFLAQS